MSSQPADTNPLADFPNGRRIGAKRNNSPHYLMSRNTRRLHRRIGPVDVGGIRSAYATRFDRDQNLSCPRRWRIPFGDFEFALL